MKQTIVSWDHFPEEKKRVEEAARALLIASKPLDHVSDYTYINGTVKAMQGRPHDPAFTDIGAAYRAQNELTSELCARGFHIDLLRSVTIPIINPHPVEVERCEVNLRRAREELESF